MDFFSVAGRNYLAVADRLTNWLSILKLKSDMSDCLIKAVIDYATTHGIPAQISSDGASLFTSHKLKQFCTRWGIKQRISSAYHPTYNKGAELAVKSA